MDSKTYVRNLLGQTLHSIVGPSIAQRADCTNHANVTGPKLVSQEPNRKIPVFHHPEVDAASISKEIEFRRARAEMYRIKNQEKKSASAPSVNGKTCHK